MLPNFLKPLLPYVADFLKELAKQDKALNKLKTKTGKIKLDTALIIRKKSLLGRSLNAVISHNEYIIAK